MKKSVILLAAASMVLAGASIIGLNRLNGASSPDQVKADGSISTWNDLKNAVKNAGNGDTIVLGADVTSGGGADDRVVIDGKNITINLNGHKVDRKRSSSSSNGHAFEIQGDSNVTFINSRNTEAESIITGGHAKNGGAINIHEGSTATFNNITFKNNYASTDGGAIFNRGHLVLNNCKIDECEAQDTGGAIYNTDKGYFDLTGVDISNCNAKNDGGAMNIYLDTKHECTISNSSFDSNYSLTEDGGAISLAEDGGVLNINNTTFSDNQAKSNKRNGGAIEVENGTLKLNGVTFQRNFAANGGAIYFAGGNNDQFLINGANVSRFEGNVASDYGGAIFSNSSTLNFTNATFLRNQATNNGGAILLHGGTATFNNGSYSENESLNESGGAIYLKSEATLNLNGGSFQANNAAGNGGAFTLNSSSETINVSGAIKTENDFAPTGPSVYLPSGSVLNVTGSLAGSSIVVAKYNRTGNFAVNYRAHNDADPSTVFIAADNSLTPNRNGDNVELVAASAEVVDELLLAPFVPSDQVVNDGEKIMSSSNWMSGISGERYLNEFNIPGTHDTSMNRIGISAGAGSAFGSGDDYAITQKRYIPDQLEEGVRILDIRLNNRYPTENWPKNKMHDDGENLWMCHGKKGGGTYYAADKNGNLINLYMVLDYARDFLTRHPSECILIGFTDESYYEEYFPAINERLHDILAKYTAEYPTNPSTGDSLWYFQGGNLMTVFDRYPQLKEVRGKIMFEPGGDIKTIGGFRSVNIGGVTKYSQSTSYKVWWDKKFDSIKDFFDADKNQYKLREGGAPWYDNGNHFEKLFRIGLNCAPQKSWWPYLPDKTPIYHSDRLFKKLFYDGDAYWRDIKGKYLGWVNTDGATEKEWGKIFRSNFIQDREDYCTVTVDPNLDGGTNYKQKTYTVLKGTTITIPNFNYKYDQVTNTNFFQGWKVGAETKFVGSTFTVTGNATFRAMWDETQNGKNDITVDVEFKDCGDVDELRPTSINFTINGGPTPTLTLTDEHGWHASYTGAISNIVPSTWEGNAKLQGFDADTAKKYRYTVKGNPAVGYTFTFIHTNTDTLTNIAGSITWQDDNDYDKYRPDTVDLTVALKDGANQIATYVFDGKRSEKTWNYTLGSRPKYRDGELIDYDIVVINDDKWAYIAEYDFIQNGYSLTAVHSFDNSNLTVAIHWADNNSGSRPTSLHVHIKADGEEILNQLISKPTEEGVLTWSTDCLVKLYKARENYDDSSERSPVNYTIEITDTNDKALSGYVVTINEIKVDEKKTNCFDVLIALEDYNFSTVTAVETKIDALGEVAYNSSFIDKLNDARSSYDALSAEKQALVKNYDTLAEKEHQFNETYGYLYEIDKEIAKYLSYLGKTPVYSECVKTLNDLGQKILDLSKEDRDLLIYGDDYNDELLRFGGIQTVYNAIAEIGDIELTNECRTSINSARTAYDALSAADKALVDNYDALVYAEAEYYALYFLQQTGAICSENGESSDHGDKLSSIWTDLSTKWAAVNADAKALLKAGAASESIADFLARYTHIRTRYNDLVAFADGPVVNQSNPSETSTLIQNRSLDVVAISLIAISSTALVGALLVALRKRKDDRAQ